MTEPHEPLTSDGLGGISIRHTGHSQLTSKKSAAQRLIDDRREYELMQPPEPAQVNVPLDVDIRFAIFKITDVDTVKQCGGIKIAVLWYWTDSRLVDWNPDQKIRVMRLQPALIGGGLGFRRRRTFNALNSM
jgi:hypothetical protein